MRSLSQSFYSQLPETADTQFAKATSELQSEVGGANVCIQLYLSSSRRKEEDSLAVFFSLSLLRSTTGSRANSRSAAHCTR